MAAQLGNRGIIDRDAHIVNSGATGARDFPCHSDQPIAEFARPDEGDVALRRDAALVMGITGKGKRRIRQQENEAAMGDAVAVDHVWLDRHRQRGFARLDLQDLHAETLAGVVFLPHRLGAGAREFIGGKCGLDVHCGLPRSRRACWNKPLELYVQSVSHDAKPPWCQRSLRASNRVRNRQEIGNIHDASPQKTRWCRDRRRGALRAPACEGRRPGFARAGDRAAQAVAGSKRGVDRSPVGGEVCGSSGDLGIRRDGTHATHLAVEADAVVEKPKNLSWEEAAGIGVPFVTAIEGFRRAGMPERGETVLVMGVNGKVGQSAVQIATWIGARVIGVVRKNEPYEGHANSRVEIIDASATDAATRVRELNEGKGADIVFNTVGDPYFQAAHQSLAVRGRQILIAAINPIVPFNILEFYRGQHSYVGIDTLGLSSTATGAVLRELRPGFASGHLKPFPIKPGAIYPLQDAKAAFLAVAGSSRDRVILRPSP